MNILKFGGNSLDTSENIRQAASVVRKSKHAIVVLSAAGSTTDILRQAAATAEAGDSYELAIRKLEEMHRGLAEELEVSQEGIEKLFCMLQDVLKGIALIKECSARSEDYLLGFGEWLICDIFTKYLAGQELPVRYLNIASDIVMERSRGAVLFEKSYENLRRRLSRVRGLVIVAGFVASTEAGDPTILGRNGADYTASLVASALGAKLIEIWSDRDGIYSADPHKVPEAFIIEKIGSTEVMELSYFGAHIIHPLTIMPAMERGIPIHVRNTFNPDTAGTVIEHREIPQPFLITAIASIDKVSLINVMGNGMVGVVGLSAKVFCALRDAEVNVMMISQASSEHSICVLCKEEDQQRALDELHHVLEEEIHSKRIHQLNARRNLEIVSIVGNNMCGRPGISGKLFRELGKAQVNVIAIAQGSSEMNISFVIEDRDSARALQVVHRAFFGEEAV